MLTRGPLFITYPSLVIAASNSCVWPSGQDASNYLVPCDPSASTSPCCSKDEVCLDSGLCYSPTQTLLYRGGCTTASGFSSEGACPSTCGDVLPSTYGNIIGCPLGGYDQGFKNYWCGAGTTCNSTGSQGTFINATGFVAGNFSSFANGVRKISLAELGGATASSTASGATSTKTGSVPSKTSLSTSSTATSPSDADTCTDASGSCHTGAVAGGIAAPLGAVALGFLFLWLYERRQRKTGSVGMQTTASGALGPYGGGVGGGARARYSHLGELDGRHEMPLEMDTHRPVTELSSDYSMKT